MGQVPLKAVCKDCVIGIRYAIGSSEGSLVFNRIQIKLYNLADCFKLMGILETVCPCKIGNTSHSSQDSSSNASQRPGLTNGTFEASQDLFNASQFAVEFSKSPIAPSGPPFQSQILESATLKGSGPHRSELSNKANESRKSPPCYPCAGRTATTGDSVVKIPQKREFSNDVSDDILKGYINKIIKEPGFGTLVKRVRGLIAQDF